MRGLFDREIYLDIETLRLSHEVDGGWSNIRGFGMAVAVTWDKENGFRRWFEEDARKLINELEQFTKVITYNGNRFDIEVLRAYAPVDNVRKSSLDLLEELHKLLGHRVKLDQVATETLGTAKSGDVSSQFSPSSPEFDLYAASITGVSALGTDMNLYAMTPDNTKATAGQLYTAGLVTMTADGTLEAASPVPLPAAVWLLGSGLLGLAGVGRRRSV